MVNFLFYVANYICGSDSYDLLVDFGEFRGVIPCGLCVSGEKIASNYNIRKLRKNVGFLAIFKNELR